MEETKKTNHELESVGRRKAVKKIVGGVTVLAAYNMLPVRWEKPIIEQVFLPAHAQTSGVAACDGCSLKDPCTITISSGNSTSSQVVVQVEGSIDQPIAGLPATITVTPKGAGIAPPVLSTKTDAQGKFTGTFTITGGPGITAVSAITKVEGAEPAGCDVSTIVEEPTPEGEEPTPEPPPSTTVSIANNSSGEVRVDYTNPSGTERTGIIAAGSSLTVQATPESYMEIYPVNDLGEVHRSFRQYAGGGAASSLTTEDGGGTWPDNHFEGNLAAGDTGTVTVTDPPS